MLKLFKTDSILVSIHLRRATLTSIHLHPAHFNLHPALCNTFNVVRTKISNNWAISPNLGPKIQSCPFWLKIGTQSISDVLIPNPDLDFWNSDPKIPFGQIWAKKSELSVLPEN